MADYGKTLMRLLPREYKKGDVIEVRALLVHPNHNGRRKLAEGGYIARHFVHSIDVFYGDTNVLSIRASTSLSQNPYFTFKLKAEKPAPLRIEYVDSKGERFSQTAEVQV
jgi:sulfur-oxidizing protein SoxZ